LAKLICGGKKTQYIEEKINDIKRKIFFIKGVYDFSYPKIIVNKVKTSQDFFNENFKDEKMKLRDSMNNISKKMIEKNEDKLAKTMEKFRTTLNIEKHKGESFINTARNFYCSDSIVNGKENDNDNDNFNFNKFPEIKKMGKTTGNFDLNSLKKMKKTLTEKFLSPQKIEKVSIINPIDIKFYQPDLGEPSKLKVIHKQKIYGLNYDER